MLQVHRSWSADMQSTQLCINFVRVCVWILSPLNTSCLPFLRNWLSSLCQVCLILSWLTSCYLESHLPEPLNPLVTHNNKKLGRCSLNEDREVEHWWVYGGVGLEACVQVRRHRCMAAAVRVSDSWKILTLFQIYQKIAHKSLRRNKMHHHTMYATFWIILNRWTL